MLTLPFGLSPAVRAEAQRGARLSGEPHRRLPRRLSHLAAPTLARLIADIMPRMWVVWLFVCQETSVGFSSTRSENVRFRRGGTGTFHHTMVFTNGPLSRSTARLNPAG